MKHNTVLVRYSEIGIKGLNRPYFENKLINNMKDCLAKNKVKDFKTKKESGRILIFTDKKCDKLSNVFGIASFSYALDILPEDLNKTALSLVKKQKSFRISARRLDKTFPKTSQQINEDTGSYILDNKKIKVSLKEPEIDIGIEIINGKVYIFSETVKGFSGLPVGTEGSAYLRVKNIKNSLVASFLILKRGASLTLSKKLPKLKKFEYGFEFKVRKENETDKVIVLDETDLIKIKKEKDRLILTPLIGLSEKEINGIYKIINSQ